VVAVAVAVAVAVVVGVGVGVGVAVVVVVAVAVGVTIMKARIPDEFILLRRPVATCEMIPEGLPGLVRINGDEYKLGYVSTLPSEGEPIIHGYRLEKVESGDVYTIGYELQEDMLSPSLTPQACTCKGNQRWRRDFGPEVCKHVRAIQSLREQGRIA
jgi:hypothetical protein